MIIPYYGMVLFSTTALELSLNPCSHRCAYCFSRLNAYQRKASFQSIMNLIKDFRNRETYTAKLLQEGYAVCVSNRSDPFAESNYREMVPIIEAMTSQNIPIFFQTKGGKGIDDVLSFIPKSHWYITICSDDDNLMKQIEPGAPLVSERFKLIEKLVSKGHAVYVGINPAVRQWIKSTDSLAKKIKEYGAYGAIFYPLHISGYQKGRQTQTEKELLSFVKIKKDRQESEQEENLLKNLYLSCKKYGLAVNGWKYGEKSTIHLQYQQIYKKCLPVFHDFINWIIDNKKDGDFVYYDDFVNSMKGIPTFEIPLRDYIMGFKRNKQKDMNIPKVASFDSLMRFAWEFENTNLNPVSKTRHLSYIVRKSSKEKGLFDSITDKKGNSIMRWHSEGFDYDYEFEDGKGVTIYD